MEMVFFRTTLTIIFAAMLAGVAQAEQQATLLQDGSYEVRFRLELPNVENWAATRTRTICIPYVGGTSNVPLPVLSSNNPFAECPAKNLQRSGADLSFDIVCEGRDGAKARAAYTLTSGGFEGRIAMVMGGKNMTMTEVQVGHRLGGCDLAGTPRS
jgi:hypothetical protein